MSEWALARWGSRIYKIKRSDYFRIASIYAACTGSQNDFELEVSLAGIEAINADDLLAKLCAES